MANKTDNSSVFNSIAAVIAVCLLASAALFYLQAGGGNSSAAQLAALSQAIPSQAASAIAAEEGAFDKLRRQRQQADVFIEKRRSGSHVGLAKAGIQRRGDPGQAW